jgi:hypothetical protein
LIAIIVDKKEDVAAFKDFDPASGQRTTKPDVTKPIPASVESSSA